MKRLANAARHFIGMLMGYVRKATEFLSWYRSFLLAAIVVAMIGAAIRRLEPFPSDSAKSFVLDLRYWACDLLFYLRFQAQQHAPRVFGTPIPVGEDVLIINMGPCPVNEAAPYQKTLRVLADHKPKAIVFDIALTDRAWTDQSARSNLVKSVFDLKDSLKHNNIIFGKLDGVLILRELKDFKQGSISAPTNRSSTIREYYRTSLSNPTLAAALADMLRTTTNSVSTPPRFWLNYYGPPGTIKSVTNLLDRNGFSNREFDNKVIFLGTGEPTNDVHRVPFTRWSGKLSTGTEIQATAFLNMSGRPKGKSDDVRFLSKSKELLIVLVVGALLGAVLSFASPLSGIAVLFVWLALSWGASVFWFTERNEVLPCHIYSIVQAAVAYGISCVRIKSVFISHKSADGKEAALLLAEFLRSKGVAVFIDADYILSGGKDPLLRLGIAQHKNFVLLVTEALISQGSAPVNFEIEEAGNAQRIKTPVLLDDFWTNPKNGALLTTRLRGYLEARLEKDGDGRLPGGRGARISEALEAAEPTEEQVRLWTMDELGKWDFPRWFYINSSDLRDGHHNTNHQELLESLARGWRPDALFSGSRVWIKAWRHRRAGQARSKAKTQ